MKPNRRRSEQGIVLVITVLVLSILALVAYAFSYSAGINLSAARNARDALQQDCRTESALRYALTMIAPTSRGGSYDALSDPWAALDLTVTVDGEVFGLCLVDENRKLNVNRAALPPADSKDAVDLRDALKRLVHAAGGVDSDADAICAWIDPNRFGANDDIAPKGPLLMISALRRVPGLDSSLFAAQRGRPALDAVLTTHPLRINLNTASKEVLDALWNNTDLTDQVLSRRVGQPFRTDEDIAEFLKGLTVISKPDRYQAVLCARSDYFTVTVTPPAGSGDEWRALVARSGSWPEVIRITRATKEVVP